MDNPWKKISKINPQREDGTRQINSKVFSALIKAKLPTAEMGVVLTVISKTWGFNKKGDTISISQLSESTGFTARAIQKANKKLVDKRIMVIRCGKKVNRGSPLNEYLFNKHYDTWRVWNKKRVNSGSSPEQPRKKRMNSGSPTIENITIENIYKYIYSDTPRQIVEFSKNFIEFISSTKKGLAPKSHDLLKNSSVVVDKLIRLDGFSLEYIRCVLQWAVQDDFWSDNLLSIAGLRKTKEGLTKFQKIAAAYERSKKTYNQPINCRSAKNIQACIDFANEAPE